MGVLNCSRKGCENIMCDKMISYSNDYICNECLNELYEKIGCNIDDFMESPKPVNRIKADPDAWRNFVNSVVTDR